MATVKIDGVDYQLQMDTGSSDLWVNTTKVPTTLVRIPTSTSDDSIIILWFLSHQSTPPPCNI